MIGPRAHAQLLHGCLEQRPTRPVPWAELPYLGRATLYRPLPPDVLPAQQEREHRRLIIELRESLRKLYTARDQDCVWSISGHRSVLAYAAEMIQRAHDEIDLILADDNLAELYDGIRKACKRGIHLTTLLTGEAELDCGRVVHHLPRESELQELTGTLMVVVGGREVLIARREVETTATITRNPNLVLIARQFVRMELFAQRIYARLGPDLLARLDPDDREIFYAPFTKLAFLPMGGERKARKEILDRLEPGGGRVLEVSIGSGVNLPYLFESQQVAQVYGLDISRGQLVRCRSFVRRRGWAVDLFLGTAEALPFREDTFDSVFHIGGINFFSDKKRAIEEMIRVARPGTRIVIADETERVAQLYDRAPGFSRLQDGQKADTAAPMEQVPKTMEDVQVEYIWKMHGHYHGYCLEFRKPRQRQKSGGKYKLENKAHDDRS